MALRVRAAQSETRKGLWDGRACPWRILARYSLSACAHGRAGLGVGQRRGLVPPRRGRRCWCGRRVLALVQERGVPVPVPAAEGSMAVMMAPWW